MNHKSFFHKPSYMLLVLSMLLLSLSAISLTRAAFAAPGDPDPTFAGFGTGGVVMPAGLINIRGLAVQPDGKIVIVGYPGTVNSFAVYRYLPDGQLDLTFDSDGKALFPGMFTAMDVALQSDGKIVVGGERNGNFHLARLTPEGALDPSFGVLGLVQDFDAELRDLRAVLVQPDGKIVACGEAKVGFEQVFGVTRYTPGGVRDVTFSGDGKATINFYGEDFCEDLALQNDGRLVLVGASYDDDLFGNDWDFAVARLNPNGTLDESFDGNGKLTTGFGEHEVARVVVLQPDGNIVVLGATSSPHQSHMARYLPDGALDGSFGSGGKRTIPTDWLQDLALQPDGRFVALGFHESPDGDKKFALHRLLANGAHDMSFDFDGIAWLDFGGSDVGQALALQSDGRILAAGWDGNAAVLARLWPDGTNFDIGGQQVYHLPLPPGDQPELTQYGNALALQPDGKFVVAGQADGPGYTFSEVFVTRFTPEGLPDLSFGVNGSARLRPGMFNAANAVAVQPDGKVVIAGSSAFTRDSISTVFLVARFHPDGAPDLGFGFNGFYLVNFEGYGPDTATALALAPDGKIVVAGNAWKDTNQVWGITRLTPDGQLDPTFGLNQDGRVYGDFTGPNAANAIAIQPDGQIIVGGHSNNDFFLHRLRENGEPDLSFGVNGYTATDLGGKDVINALVLAPNGWIYAAGHRLIENSSSDGSDIALAQYTPDGLLASCPDPANCDHWPTGSFFVNVGSHDIAYALDLREDNQLVAAGCINDHFAAVQVPTDAGADYTPFLYQTDFVGNPDCARAVKFTSANQILLAGNQDLYPFSKVWNMALARFETAESPIP